MSWKLKQEPSEALAGSVIMHAVYLHWPGPHNSDSKKKQKGEKERKKNAFKGMNVVSACQQAFDRLWACSVDPTVYRTVLYKAPHREHEAGCSEADVESKRHFDSESAIVRSVDLRSPC
jgi:hypothetical protein